MMQLLLCCLCLLQTTTFVVWGQQNNDFEIKALTGEPDYRSVNLSWAIDHSVKTKIGARQAKSFTVFYCELQTWGPHRCKSKVVGVNEILDPIEEQKQQQYSVTVDNLRMATKYFFHVKPQNRDQVISRRSDDASYSESNLNGPQRGQTIIIPTKGFSAHATKCLPDASEIVVETGPYFGGRIVVEGGKDCMVQGDYNSERDQYVMRIDHEKCGSSVDRETLTVKTFITVQENLGIFTHSTRRFLVVCTYQPDTMTIRASFSVPGKGAISPILSDWDNDRSARDRKFRMVDKSSLVLKDDYDVLESNPNDIQSKSLKDIESKELENKENGIKSGRNLTNSTLEKQLRLDEKLNTNNVNYARLINNSDKINEEADINFDYTGLIMGISLSFILTGVLIFILQKESSKRRMVRS